MRNGLAGRASAAFQRASSSLYPRRRRGAAATLPSSSFVRIAVIGIDTVMGDERMAVRQAVERQLHVRRRRRQIVIMIVPDQHGYRSCVLCRERIDVRRATHAVVANLLEPASALELSTCRRSPRIIPSMRNTFSTGLSMPLVARSRNPAKYGWSSNSNAHVTVPRRLILCRSRKLVGAGNLRRRVARVQRSVSIGVLRIGANRAGGAPFRVGFADDDRRVAELGERRDDLEPV